MRIAVIAVMLISGATWAEACPCRPRMGPALALPLHRARRLGAERGSLAHCLWKYVLDAPSPGQSRAMTTGALARHWWLDMCCRTLHRGFLVRRRLHVV